MMLNDAKINEKSWGFNDFRNGCMILIKVIDNNSPRHRSHCSGLTPPHLVVVERNHFEGLISIKHLTAFSKVFSRTANDPSKFPIVETRQS